MSKAGKGDSVDTGSVGSQHPVPENIPHLSSPINSANGIGNMLLPHQHHTSMQAGSPVKESSFLNRETSAEDIEGVDKEQQQGPGQGAPAADQPLQAAANDAASATGQFQTQGQEGIPIRR